MKRKFLSIIIFLFLSIFSLISQAQDTKYTCDGWMAFVLEDSNGAKEDKSYILRDKKEIIRRGVMNAESAHSYNLANEIVIFSKSKNKTPKAKTIQGKDGRERAKQIVCWRDGVDRVPDTSSWPIDNTGRIKTSPPLFTTRQSTPKDPKAPYECTQRLVYYLLGEDPKTGRKVFIYSGEDRTTRKRKKYPAPQTAAQSEIRKEALELLKKKHDGVNIMLIDDPPATCMQ